MSGVEMKGRNQIRSNSHDTNKKLQMEAALPI